MKRLQKKFCFYLFLAVLSGFCHRAFAQNFSGIVIEKSSRLPVSFASVTYRVNGRLAGTISDINGKFRLNGLPEDSLTVSCTGYKRIRLNTPDQSVSGFLKIELEPISRELQEVTVVPGENPAIRIMQLLWKSKNRNDFTGYEHYRYTNYLKTLIDLKQPTDTSIGDSTMKNTSMKKQKLVKSQVMFISEQLFSHAKSGNKKSRQMLSHHTSGFRDAVLPELFDAVFQNTISFYQNQIPLFKTAGSGDLSLTEYVSPAANYGIRLYQYELEETISSGADTIFIITFQPKKGKTFNGLRGRLFVHSNGYAIQRAVAEPSETGLIAFKFLQDYKLVNNRWFPERLEEEIGWVNMQIPGMAKSYPVYRITSTISEVDFAPGKAFESADPSEKKPSTPAGSADSLIRIFRPDSLSSRELKTFQKLDSIGKEKNLDGKIRFMPSLASGKIPVRFIDLDLFRLYGYNHFEGPRIGTGLSTNEKISSLLSLGGFAAYGLKDKRWKYGGHLLATFRKWKNLQIKISMQDNLRETGFELQDNLFNPSADYYLRSYAGFQFDRCREEKLMVSFQPIPSLKISTGVILNQVNPLYDYRFQEMELTAYRADEFQFQCRFAPGTENFQWGNHPLEISAGNPVITINFSQGTNQIHPESFRYQKAEASIDYRLYHPMTGQTNFRLAGGYAIGNLPYSSLFTGQGSRDREIPLVISNYFQTIRPYEFLSDRYLHLFFTHNFGSLLFRSKNFRPQPVLMHNAGIGSLRNRGVHSLSFRTMEKIMLESGLQLQNIIRFNYLDSFYFGFGAGVFCRYGSYAEEDLKSNLVYKLNFSISLN